MKISHEPHWKIVVASFFFLLKVDIGVTHLKHGVFVPPPKIVFH